MSLTNVGIWTSSWSSFFGCTCLRFFGIGESCELELVLPSLSGKPMAKSPDDLRLRDGVLSDGVLSDGVLIDGVLSDGVLIDGVLSDGVLIDGVLIDGILIDGVLKDNGFTVTFGKGEERFLVPELSDLS
ncbi:hypothetical protein GQX73_g10505 [Xylaria multiplex]|uniref:Uncharacterized protein n=1 Tax=Xylaria multiplex TaxID=323545 RepID=A0A7C8MFA9_9PEZI|nr:hypothetical protein GQX73_g10505 [Xylaria multiplex]